MNNPPFGTTTDTDTLNCFSLICNNDSNEMVFKGRTNSVIFFFDCDHDVPTSDGLNPCKSLVVSSLAIGGFDTLASSNPSVKSKFTFSCKSENFQQCSELCVSCWVITATGTRFILVVFEQPLASASL